MPKHHEISEEIPPHYLLFGGPRLRQPAAFFGQWLQAASRLNEFWQEAMRDPKFATRSARLCCPIALEPNFELAAIQFLTRLKLHPFYGYQPFVVHLAAEEAVEITIMVLVGLFAKFGSRYDFAIPDLMGPNVVEAASLQLASTEDDEDGLHPEYVVESVSPEIAENWEATQSFTDLRHAIPLIADETTWH